MLRAVLARLVYATVYLVLQVIDDNCATYKSTDEVLVQPSGTASQITFRTLHHPLLYYLSVSQKFLICALLILTATSECASGSVIAHALQISIVIVYMHDVSLSVCNVDGL